MLFVYHACMKRPLLLILVAVCLSACQAAAPAPALSPTQPATLPTPFPSATPAVDPDSPSAPPQVAVLSPLVVDEARGLLYMVGQVDGQPRTAALDANDGHVVRTFEPTGQLALDAQRNRLYIDTGGLGLAIVDPATGQTLATVPLPAANATVAPQVEPSGGLVYAFRESTIYTIDPVSSAVVAEKPLAVERVVCDQPQGTAPIYSSAFDPAAFRLYLSFINTTCVPWAGMAIVAYDAATLAETGRMDADAATQMIARDGRLYGTSVSRLGPTVYWVWDGQNPPVQQSGDFAGGLNGIAVDSRRGLLLEGLGMSLRASRLETREAQGTLAALPVEGRLAGYDPNWDQLYIVSPAGRLHILSGDVLAGDLEAAPAPSVLPHAPVRALVLSPNWAVDETMAGLWDVPGCAGGRQFFLFKPEGGWRPAAAGETGACPSIAAVAFSSDYTVDQTIFAADNLGSVLRSSDGGTTWAPTAGEDGAGFPPGARFRALFVSPAFGADRTLFVLTEDGGLYRSADAGQTWARLASALDVVDLLPTPTEAPYLLAASGGQLLRSTDGGDTWEAAGALPESGPVALLRAVPSARPEPTVFALTSGGGFYRSLDGGATWTLQVASAPARDAQLALAPEMTEEERPVLLLQDGSITASYDGGASVWAATPADAAGAYQPTALALSPAFAADGLLVVGTADGQVLRLPGDPFP